MQRRRAQALKNLEMFRRAITLMVSKTVAGELHIVRYHHPVASDLGDDRGRGYTKALAITTDYSRLWQFQFWNETSVDQNMIGSSQQ